MKSVQRLFGNALLAASFLLAGCTTVWSPENERKTEPFERGKALLAEGNYDGALQENQRLLSEGKGAPDVALFNMGMIAANSSNPKKNYPRALVYFKTLVKDHPHSPLTEQAKVWIQVLEEHQKMAEEKQKLVEEKRTLTREREMLAQEKEKLKYTVEKSRQVDIEIEKRRRQTLQK